MDKAPVQQAGCKKKTGIGIKKSKSKKGKSQIRKRKKHGAMENIPVWKPFGM